MSLKSRLSSLWANRARYIGNERGEIKWGGGGKQSQTSTTTSAVAPLTPQQLALYNQNLQLAQLQGQGLQDAIAKQQAWEASPFMAQQQQLGTLAANQINARLNGQMYTPQEQQQIEQLYAAQHDRGLSDLQAAAQQAAQMRGMTIADSPIGNGYLQSVQRFGNDLASAQAGTGLQLGQANQQFWQNIMGNVNQLQQQAQQNRASLASLQPTGFGLQNSIDQFRAATAPKTTTTTGTMSQSPQFGIGISSIGQGIGGIGQGLGAYDRYQNPERYDQTAQFLKALNNGRGLPLGSQPAPAPVVRPLPVVNDYWGNS